MHDGGPATKSRIVQIPLIILVSLGLAALVVASLHAVPVAAAVSDTGLLQRWAIENEHCRGDSGDKPETWEHCGARDFIGELLRADGWCYGEPGQIGAEQDWHKCARR